jgi:beta-galactosidase
MHSQHEGGSQRSVKIVGTTIEIDGIPRTLMCSSLFPFRVPRSQWRTRLQAVKNLGYQVIDTYAPWNWHETSPGHFDFTGQNDFEEFLRLTAQTGLYALVRPGPYICSEWDNGGIPAWISTDPALKGKLRQNDPDFLAAVGRWYDQIVPIIARQQYGNGGPVILVQVDNELDFYSCRDPQGYISSLSQMMRERGVTVPIIACAGQGDLRGAGFGAPGVHPAFNIYPDDMSADVDKHVRYHRRVLDRENEPFIVTETNRWHRTIGRAIGNGVRLVGPYLQASGQDLAAGSTFGTSVTNWGPTDAPETFLTSDYDFGGTIDPSGAERADAARARRLSAIISALSVRLAASSLPSEEAIYQQAEQWGIGRQYDDQSLGLGVLDLRGGGRLVTVTNVSSRTITCVLDGERLGSEQKVAQSKTAHIAPGESRMLVWNMPIGPVESRADSIHMTSHHPRVAATNCELIGLEINEIDGSGDDGASLTFAASPAETDSWVALVDADGTEHCVSGAGRHVIGSIVVTIVSAQSQADEEKKRAEAQAVAPVQQITHVGKVSTPVLANLPAWKQSATDADDSGDPQILEHYGVWNGTGIYSTSVNEQTAQRMQGLVLRGAADIVSARGNGTGSQNDWTDWTANAGQPMWIPVRGSRLQVRTQIWGHCNFDDSRLPALSLSAGRGITGAIAVTDRLPYSTGWLLANDTHPVVGLKIDSEHMPRGPLGSRSSTVWPRHVTYRRTIRLTSHLTSLTSLASQTADNAQPASLGAALELKKTQVRAKVCIDGREVDDITPLKPMTWLGPVHDGSRLEVTIYQSWGEAVGEPTLLVGPMVRGWNLQSRTLTDLNSAVRTLFAQSDSFSTVQLPLHVPSGSQTWIRIPASELSSVSQRGCAVCRPHGEHLQITAFTRSLCLGRVVLSGLPRVAFTGGDPSLLMIPDDGDGNAGAGDVLMLLEATAHTGGNLTSITLGGPVDQSR